MTYKSVTVTDNENKFVRSKDFPAIRGHKITEVKDFYTEMLELCQPTPVSVVISELTAMTISMARRADQEADYKALLLVYAKDLSEYPEDVILDTCTHMRRSQKFFPTISELIAACEERYEFRRLLRAECESLLEGRKALIAPDNPAEMHFKSLPVKEWLPLHYDQWVEEAERMVELCKQNPDAFKEAEWKEFAERRRQVRDARLREAVSQKEEQNVS